MIECLYKHLIHPISMSKDDSFENSKNIVHRERNMRLPLDHTIHIFQNFGRNVFLHIHFTEYQTPCSFLQLLFETITGNSGIVIPVFSICAKADVIIFERFRKLVDFFRSPHHTIEALDCLDVAIY